MNSGLPQPSSVQRKQISKLAITSMGFGILSLASLFTIPNFITINSDPSTNTLFNKTITALPIGILAIVFGVISLLNIRKYQNHKGTALVIIGLICTGIAFVPFLLYLFLYLLIHLHLYVT